MDVSSRLPGQIRASNLEGPRRVSDALVLEPLREENYYEVSPWFFLLFMLWFTALNVNAHILGSILY